MILLKGYFNKCGDSESEKSREKCTLVLRSSRSRRSSMIMYGGFLCSWTRTSNSLKNKIYAMSLVKNNFVISCEKTYSTNWGVPNVNVDNTNIEIASAH